MQLRPRIAQTSLLKEIFVAFLLMCSIFILQRVGWSELAIKNVGSFTAPMTQLVANSIFFVEQPLLALDNLFNSSAELSVLKVKYAKSMAELAELDKVRAENQQLRSMIENKHLVFTERTIASPIVSYAYPAVSAGETQGVHVGSLVVLSDTLIGRVVQTQNNQSRIELLSNVDAEPVLAVTESGHRGLVKGNGKGVILSQLPPDAQLEIGERLVSVGQAGVKPGIFLGLVAGNNSVASSPTKTVPVDQLVSFYTAALVEIQ